MSANPFSIEFRILLVIVGALGLLYSCDGWRVIDEEALARKVASGARSFNQTPASVRHTDMGILGAQAQGTTLVLTLKSIPSGNGIFEPEHIRPFVFGLICNGKGLQKIIEQGATVRFEGVTNTGKRLAPVEVKGCP